MTDDEVDQTIQWARESLKRRRSELNRKKQEFNSSSEVTSATTAVDVNSILERGRALLKQAEAHSESLGQYVERVPGNNEDQHNNDNFMAKFLQSTDKSNDLVGSNATHFASIPVEKPCWSHRHHDEDYREQLDSAQDTHPEEDDNDLVELLKEGEARVRLDNLIATIRRQGDNPISSEVERSLSPVRRVSDFDPDELRAAKRAVIKKIKLEEAVARAEKEARNMSNFKALPLPGGVEVQHDIFAPTLAFQGKHAGIELVCNGTRSTEFRDFSSSRSLGGFESFDRMSVATSCTSIDGPLNLSFANEEDKEKAIQLRQAKKAKKKKLLDSVNRTIAAEMGELIDDDVSVACSVRSAQSHVEYLEDPSKLRQQIARLEVKLKRKKSQRSATLNDIVDIDLNSIFERLLSEDADEDAHKIVDRLKRKVCGNIEDGILIEDLHPQLPQLGEHHTWNEDNYYTTTPVLFKRQENWIQQREQKLVEARLRLEAEEMSDITGQPRLSHTKDSWKKAKNAHDEALKRVAEKEARRQVDKAEHERLEYEAKMKEAQDLTKRSNGQTKPIRIEVNKEEQMKRLEKLSQPRQVRLDSSLEEIRHHGGNHNLSYIEQNSDPSDTPYGVGNTNKKSIKKAPKPVVSSTSNYVEFSGKRFSEMDDKEFKRIVKRIGMMAKQKFNNEDENLSQGNRINIVGNPDNLCDEPIEFGGGRFYGSAAQAKFMQQLAKK